MSALKGSRSTLSSVFKYKIPDLQDSFILQALIRSFELESGAILISKKEMWARFQKCWSAISSSTSCQSRSVPSFPCLACPTSPAKSPAACSHGPFWLSTVASLPCLFSSSVSSHSSRLPCPPACSSSRPPSQAWRSSSWLSSPDHHSSSCPSVSDVQPSGFLAAHWSRSPRLRCSSIRMSQPHHSSPRSDRSW